MNRSAIDSTRSIFIFTGVVLFLLGIGSLLRNASSPNQAGLYTFYVLAMFVDGALFLFCAWWLGIRTKWSFYFSLLVLAFNILPTIFDQFGLADLLFVLLNFATLIALLAARREFLPA
ncbi:MAG: hypothetical protein IT315_00505 [Anaerolineales bacterium]|nr:hypothetical protein [Anaerolineales bacterium]